MAVSFEVPKNGIDEDQFKVRVYGLSVGDRVRVFVRKKDDTTDKSWDETGTYSGDRDYYLDTVKDLQRATRYLVNVMINPTNTASDTWLGAQEAITVGYICEIRLDDDGDGVHEASVDVEIYEHPPDITAPLRTGYVFMGYFTEPGGNGVQYYDQYGESTRSYDGPWDYITIYAYWQEAGAVFAWTTEKVQGEEFKLTADEWNALAAFVNSERSRAYSFTAAVSGQPFTAAMYNEMVEAIGTGTEVEKGDPVTAALLNALVTNANNM